MCGSANRPQPAGAQCGRTVRTDTGPVSGSVDVSDVTVARMSMYLGQKKSHIKFAKTTGSHMYVITLRRYSPCQYPSHPASGLGGQTATSSLRCEL